jgi:hypothetical protein
MVADVNEVGALSLMKQDKIDKVQRPPRDFSYIITHIMYVGSLFKQSPVSLFRYCLLQD